MLSRPESNRGGHGEERLCHQEEQDPGLRRDRQRLYFADRTWMPFGDAKVVIGELVNNRATGEVRGDLGGTLVMDNVDATRTGRR